MDCPDCEKFAQFIFPSTDIYFNFPLTHTSEKFSAFTARVNMPCDVVSETSSKITVDAAGISRFLTELAGVMTEEELASTSILTSPTGTIPALKDFGRVVPLARLISAGQATWVEKMLNERRYKSVYQPMFTPSGQMAAVEALFRGSDDNGAMISPAFIFDLARSAKMSFQLDLAARRSAVNLAAAAKLQDLKLFINFNPSSIYDPAYCLRTTVSTIQELGFTPGNVVFEVTESDRVTNLDHLKGILTFYRRSGFKIALDDVGAGYSGLNLLNDLRPDYIKVDMHLVRDIDTDSYRQSIVSHIIGIAKDNGALIVAEGIETESEWLWLKAKGVDLAQGYYFAKPVEADQVRNSALKKAA